MKIENLVGDWKRTSFDPQKNNKIPRESGLYVLTNFSGDILYVGISVNLYRRFSEHLKSKKYSEVSPSGRVFWFYYTLCQTEEHRSLERGVLSHIELHEGKLPWFNQVRAPT